MMVEHPLITNVNMMINYLRLNQKELDIVIVKMYASKGRGSCGDRDRRDHHDKRGDKSTTPSIMLANDNVLHFDNNNSSLINFIADCGATEHMTHS